MIFGTLGQSAAGTSEKLTPRTRMSTTASAEDLATGSRNAKLRWQITIIIAPTRSMVAPFPFLSRNKPRNGVSTIARMGNTLNSLAAKSASTPRVTSR